MFDSNIESWKSWVAQNLALGADSISLTLILVQNGFPQEQSAQLIDEISRSPQLKVMKELVEVVRKREWLLSMLDAQFRHKKKYKNLPKRIKAPNLKRFLNSYYYENLPVILTDAVNHWPAMRWTPENLRDRIQSAEVQVQYGRSTNANYERDSVTLRKMMPFDEYVSLVLATESSNEFYMTANNWEKTKHVFAEIYHDIGNIADGYLNESQTLDSAFLWLGPKGTLTPLHHDLTNNLFVQIYGRKRVFLIPALQIPYLYNSFHVYSDVDVFNIDLNKFPNFAHATVMDFILNPGETLFIPNGWMHAVEALDVSISITFTNFNAVNDLSRLYPR